MKMSSGNQEAMSTKAPVIAVDENKASSMMQPANPSPSSSGLRLGSMTASYHVKALAILVAIVLCGGSLGLADGLKCHMCGQYNEGVGSITPCTNYTKDIAHLYLKECTKKSEKFCVKYVSELSTVRDCATECQEKEIWETQTYCCTEDGCNSGTQLAYSVILLTLPILSMAWPKFVDFWNARR
ncbi:uncharacterized protein LOC108032051 [Drosophila biarmipes]|uniref:uncharacterized protein LOC108032051 n=1 Tax=Drosophila biarmipes TaxID=125945 RepID=UPI0007E7F2F3|nr:uncharacterized protein LOC108032051 [Drosophila biarmipes]XP_016961354.1 uncharacterized protein LOC108032051 [Drosophila biarmipes]